MLQLCSSYHHVSVIAIRSQFSNCTIVSNFSCVLPCCTYRYRNTSSRLLAALPSWRTSPYFLSNSSEEGEHCLCSQSLQHAPKGIQILLMFWSSLVASSLTPHDKARWSASPGLPGREASSSFAKASPQLHSDTAIVAVLLYHFCLDAWYAKQHQRLSQFLSFTSFHAMHASIHPSTSDCYHLSSYYWYLQHRNVQ